MKNALEIGACQYYPIEARKLSIVRIHYVLVSLLTSFLNNYNLRPCPQISLEGNKVLLMFSIVR